MVVVWNMEMGSYTQFESSSSQPSFNHTQFPLLNESIQFQEQYQSRNVESEREVAKELHDKLVCRSLSNRNRYSPIKFNLSKIHVV